ncbi:MAG: hypothetical protein P1U56_13190 [Saprospiraceae bacterium]|nr:hypothetical protein [Saprospiraceae bacterium]
MIINNRTIIKGVLSFLLGCITLQLFAAQYTFQNSGVFSDPNNWDNYPGSTFSIDDTVYITENCFAINLSSFPGRMEITGNTTLLDFDYAFFEFASTLAFDMSLFIIDITINGELTIGGTVEEYGMIATITNYGNGLYASELFDISIFENYGTQTEFLESFQTFYNYGTLELFSPFVRISSEFYMECGTITSFLPYTLIFDLYVNQVNDNCSATIENVNEVIFETSNPAYIKNLQIIKAE